MLSKRWLAVLLFCVGIFVLLALIKFFQVRAAIEFGESFPEPSETVQYQAVAYSNWRPTIQVIGEILAPQEVVLRTETAGVIAKLGFKPGAEVKQGDVLLQLDVAEEQARLAALEPQLELARKDYERLAGIKRQAVSQQLIDQAKSRLGVARGEVAAVKESIVNKTVIAPFDGISGLHDFELGEYIAADTLVTRLVGDTQELWVDFQLPQQHSQIDIGSIVMINAPGLFEGKLEATVSVVEPAFSRATRSLGVRAIFPKTQYAPTPGSIVNVAVPSGQTTQVVSLPSTAVRHDQFGSFVYLLNRDEADQWRASPARVVELAKAGLTSFLEPSIAEGDRVATTGAFKLSEGKLVNLIEPESSRDQTISPQQVGEVEGVEAAPSEAVILQPIEELDDGPGEQQMTEPVANGGNDE